MRIVNTRYSETYFSSFLPFHTHFSNTFVRSFVRLALFNYITFALNERNNHFTKSYPISTVRRACMVVICTCSPRRRLAFRPLFNSNWVVWNTNEISNMIWIIKMRSDFDCETENLISMRCPTVSGGSFRILLRSCQSLFFLFDLICCPRDNVIKIN